MMTIMSDSDENDDKQILNVLFLEIISFFFIVDNVVFCYCIIFKEGKIIPGATQNL